MSGPMLLFGKFSHTIDIYIIVIDCALYMALLTHFQVSFII